MRIPRLVAMGVAGAFAVVALGCGGDGSPTAGSIVPVPDGTFQSPLDAVSGPGEGALSVTPVSNASGKLDMIIKIRLKGARPSTRYLVQRAGEIGRVNSADGVCQRAVGASPWSPSDPPVAALFTSFHVPEDGPEVAFTTDANGGGSFDFEYNHPSVTAGTVFDLMVRVADRAVAPTTELRGACFTVTAR